MLPAAALWRAVGAFHHLALLQDPQLQLGGVLHLRPSSLGSFGLSLDAQCFVLLRCGVQWGALQHVARLQGLQLQVGGAPANLCIVVVPICKGVLPFVPLFLAGRHLFLRLSGCQLVNCLLKRQIMLSGGSNWMCML